MRAGGNPVNIGRKASDSELDARLHGHDENIDDFREQRQRRVR
jgi:hypothetical protein